MPFSKTLSHNTAAKSLLMKHKVRETKSHVIKHSINVMRSTTKRGSCIVHIQYLQYSMKRQTHKLCYDIFVTIIKKKLFLVIDKNVGK